MTLLITGTSGFIGRRLKRAVSTQLPIGEIVGLEHRWDGIDCLRRLIPDRVEACVHLAWAASSTNYLNDVRSNRESFIASIELAHVLVERECQHLVIAGSCAEYAQSDRPVYEESSLRADSPYAEYKIRLHESLPEFGIPFAWTRLFGVVGPGESASRLMSSVVRSLLTRTDVPLSPGEQVRDLIDVDDVARALLALSNTREVGVFNVCRGEPVVLRDFLFLLADVMHADRALLNFGRRPYGLVDPMYVVGDPTHLQASIGDWYPEFDTLDMARRIVTDVTGTDVSPASSPDH